MASLPEGFYLRDMRLDDLEQVADLDRLSFPLPWSLSSYRYEILQSKISHCWVVETNQNTSAIIAALMVFYHVVDEVHIATIAVDERYRRTGIASCLIEELLVYCNTHKAQRVFLEVRLSNLAAQALYIKHGFVFTGVRKRYYSDNHEDALLMERILDNQ
ncbi:MAG TPA: ribosomal-protein-alanine N-acetyltransferase [Chloroflexi bacterium]|nr:ribosomal-protein-alanine N-acetyltransferase [Chloroflexota bacterium]